MSDLISFKILHISPHLQPMTNNNNQFTLHREWVIKWVSHLRETVLLWLELLNTRIREHMLHVVSPVEVGPAKNRSTAFYLMPVYSSNMGQQCGGPVRWRRHRVVCWLLFAVPLIATYQKTVSGVGCPRRENQCLRSCDAQPQIERYADETERIRDTRCSFGKPT